jgi:hypothetical protein
LSIWQESICPVGAMPRIPRLGFMNQRLKHLVNHDVDFGEEFHVISRLVVGDEHPKRIADQWDAEEDNYFHFCTGRLRVQRRPRCGRL